MSSKQTLHDKNGNDIYPITLASAVFNENGDFLSSTLDVIPLYLNRINNLINDANGMDIMLIPNIKINEDYLGPIEVYIYNNGAYTNTELSGTFKPYQSGMNVTENNNNNLHISSSESDGNISATTEKAINISEIKSKYRCTKLVFNVYRQYGSSVCRGLYGLSSAPTSSSNYQQVEVSEVITGNTGGILLEIDITNLEGDYYLKVVINESYANYYDYSLISSIYFA